MTLQRLFSTFPNSWPGLGLLLLRACFGIALISLGIAVIAEKSQDLISLAPSLLSGIGGVFILAGLWTPVMGTVVALDEIWIASLLYSHRREDAWAAHIPGDRGS